MHAQSSSFNRATGRSKTTKSQLLPRLHPQVPSWKSAFPDTSRTTSLLSRQDELLTLRDINDTMLLQDLPRLANNIPHKDTTLTRSPRHPVAECNQSQLPFAVLAAMHLSKPPSDILSLALKLRRRSSPRTELNKEQETIPGTSISISSLPIALKIHPLNTTTPTQTQELSLHHDPTFQRIGTNSPTLHTTPASNMTNPTTRIPTTHSIHPLTLFTFPSKPTISAYLTIAHANPTRIINPPAIEGKSISVPQSKVRLLPPQIELKSINTTLAHEPWARVTHGIQDNRCCAHIRPQKSVALAHLLRKRVYRKRIAR